MHPRFALSVRQPWAWAIIHGGKDIENRAWSRGNPGLEFRGRVAIHAATGMTRAEYDDAAETIFENIGNCPGAAELVRGGIIGTAEIVDVVTGSESRWFAGPVGLVLRDPLPIEPIPCRGALGFFEWHPDPEAAFAVPAVWMLPSDQDVPIEIKDAIDALLDRCCVPKSCRTWSKRDLITFVMGGKKHEFRCRLGKSSMHAANADLLREIEAAARRHTPAAVGG